jgi:hypothetical protein
LYSRHLRHFKYFRHLLQLRAQGFTNREQGFTIYEEKNEGNISEIENPCLPPWREVNRQAGRLAGVERLKS